MANNTEDPLQTLMFGLLGGVVGAFDDWTGAVERGRIEAKARVASARIIGQFAVGYGQKEVEKKVRELADRIVEMAMAILAQAAQGPDDSTTPTETADIDLAQDPQSMMAPLADELAIPSYPTLSATQIMDRLGGLTANDLRHLRRYEEAHRSRLTILDAIDAQLRDAP